MPRTSNPAAPTPLHSWAVAAALSASHGASQPFRLPTKSRRRFACCSIPARAAMVAIGDQVYWDLLAPENGPKMGASPAGERIAGKFNRSALVLGSDNETVLKRAVEPQLIEVYGTDFRSTPVFFMQDDHDYFDNDEATDEVITFPPPYFSLQLARATQSLFYPEFLPDRA